MPPDFISLFFYTFLTCSCLLLLSSSSFIHCDATIPQLQRKYPFLNLHSIESLQMCSTQLQSCVKTLEDASPPSSSSSVNITEQWSSASNTCSAQYCSCLPNGRYIPSSGQCAFSAVNPDHFCGILETCVPVYASCVRVFELNQVVNISPECSSFIQCTSQVNIIDLDKESCINSRIKTYSACDVSQTCRVDPYYDPDTKWNGPLSSNNNNDNNDDDPFDGLFNGSGISISIITIFTMIGLGIIWSICIFICIACIRVHRYMRYANANITTTTTTTTQNLGNNFATHQRLHQLELFFRALRGEILPNAAQDRNGSLSLRRPIQRRFRSHPIHGCDVCTTSQQQQREVSCLTLPCLCALCADCAVAYSENLTTNNNLCPNCHQEIQAEFIPLSKVYTSGIVEFDDPHHPIPSLSPTNTQQHQQEEDVGDDDTAYCVICLDQHVNTLFVPCGHYATCADCSEKIANTTGQCPLCRTCVDILCFMNTTTEQHTQHIISTHNNNTSAAAVPSTIINMNASTTSTSNTVVSNDNVVLFEMQGTSMQNTEQSDDEEETDTILLTSIRSS